VEIPVDRASDWARRGLHLSASLAQKSSAKIEVLDYLVEFINIAPAA
jgi:hypothetical protein